MLGRPSLCPLVVLPLAAVLLSACSDGSTAPAAAGPAEPAERASARPAPPPTPGDDVAGPSAAAPSAAEPTAAAAEPVTSATAEPTAAVGSSTAAPPASEPLPPAPAPASPEDPLSPQPALETPPPVAASTCRAADLSVVDADSLFTPTALTELFVVRTTGPDCQVQGYPAVRLLGPDGAALPVQVRSGGGGLPARDAGPVTLSRSTSMSFLLATSRDQPCADVSTVAVTLPGTGGTLRAPTELTVCGGAAAVSPVGRQDDDEHGDEDGA